MEKVIADYVSGLAPGEPRVYKNFAVIPLFHPADDAVNAVCVVNEPAREEVSMERVARREQADSRARQEEVRWTTKQVAAACLWSALFGLGCGYGWLLLQAGTAVCR